MHLIIRMGPFVLEHCALIETTRACIEVFN